MKIYPGRHNITLKESVNTDTDIPLAFLDTEHKEYKTVMTSHTSFSEMNLVVPYTEFDNFNVKFTDKERTVLSGTNLLQRNKDKYIYVPQGATTFDPQRFNYSVIGKRKMTYKTSKQYDLKISCADNTSLNLSGKLMKIFGNAADRLLCPKNISVNSKDMSIQSLTNSAIYDNDFIFIESETGLYYKGTEVEIDYQAYLDGHINVWVITDGNPISTVASATKTDMIFKTPLLYNNVPLPSFVFDTEKFAHLDGVVYHNLFTGSYTGMVIKETVGQGFTITTPVSFLNDLEANVKIVYETLMYVYMNGYTESETYNDWITDVLPDYVVSNGRLVKKTSFASTMEFYRMLELNRDEVDLVSIKTDPSNIQFVGISGYHIMFKKNITGDNIKYADPIKTDAKMISVFTERQNILLYKDYVYLTEDDVKDKITCTIVNDDTLVVSVKPFIRSKDGINITEIQPSLTKALYETINYKITKISNATILLICKDNLLDLVNKKEYTVSAGIIIAEIKISQTKSDPIIYDMRQRGGGYPEIKLPPVQSLLDIGNLEGMSYRKAGTLIITLPKRLEQFEDMINTVVRKHMSAEEFPVILFEDKED